MNLRSHSLIRTLAGIAARAVSSPATKIVVTIGLLAYILSRVNLSEVGARLASANPWLVLLALTFYLGAIIMNGIKWAVLLRAQDVHVPFRAVLQYIFVGFFFNNVLPANIGGDVMRGYGMARYTDRTAETAVSVIIDRFVGLLAYMGAAAVMAIVLVITTQNQQLQALIYWAIAALVIIATAFAVIISRRLRGLIGHIFGWRLLLPLAPIYERLSNAFDAYRFRYSTLVLSLGIALFGLFLTNFVNWFLSEAMGGDIELLHIFLFNPLIALVLLVPISIGGHGVIQGAYPFFYGLVGVPPEHAIAVSLLMSFVVIAGSLPGGLLWWRGRRQRHDAAEQLLLDRYGVQTGKRSRPS